MRRPQRERHIEVAFPVALQLVGQREDQVERDVLDAGATQGVHRGTDARGVVRAVHPLEHVVIERLGAEGDAVDAGGAPGAA